MHRKPHTPSPELLGVRFYEAPNGLLLPSETQRQARLKLALDGDVEARGPVAILNHSPSSFDQFMVVLDEAALGLPATAPSTLENWASNVGFEVAALAFAKLAIWIDDLPARASAQLDLGRKIFSLPDWHERVEEFLAEHPRAVVVSSQQLTALARLNLLNAEDRPLTQPGHQYEGLLLERILIGASVLVEDETAPGADGTFRDWVPFLVRNGAFNGTEPLLEAFGRTAALLDAANSSVARARRDHCDLEEWAVDESGLTLRHQLAAGFAVMGSAGAITAGEPQSATGLLAPDYFESLADRLEIEDPGARALRQLLTADRRWFVNEFRELEEGFGLSAAEAASGYNRTPFERRPFLRLTDGRFLLWSPKAITSWLTDGFYYRALDRARTLGRRNDFQRFWAFLVEDYVRSTLDEAHPRPRPVGSGRVHEPVSYSVRKQAHESPDIAMDFGYDLVFIEVFSGRLSLEARITGRVEKVFADIRKMTAYKGAQLSRRIDDYLAGYFEIPDVDTTSLLRIWPVVVTGPGLFMSEALWDQIQDELAGALRQPRVQPLTILDLADIEQMVGLVHAGWDVPGLLARKVGGYRGLDWRRMVADDPHLPEVRSPIVVEHWERAARRMVGDLGWDPEEFDARRHDRAA